VLAGAAVAIGTGHYEWTPLWLCWLASVAVQAGTNLTNVYFNYKAVSPGDQPDPHGSSAVIQLGWLTRREVRTASLVCFAVGLIVGLALTWLRGWPILLLGLPGAAAGYFYAAPPLRLAYKAMGVITVFVFMGPVMIAGTCFAMSGAIPPGVWAVAIAVGLMAAGVMHINDLRDFEGDRRHGKRTLTTLLGRPGSRRLLLAMDVTAYLSIVTAAIAGVLPWFTLLVVVSIPRAISQLRLVFRETEAAKLNPAWTRSVQLHLEFGAALIAGLMIAVFTRIS
jgi:1,4-dihydroxy-2-naphthoate octaprenyltransferase